MELSFLPSLLFFPFSARVRFLSELDFYLGNSQPWIPSGSSLIFISICLSVVHKASLVTSWTAHLPVGFLPSCFCVSILFWSNFWVSVLIRRCTDFGHSLPALCNPGLSSKSLYVLWQSRFYGYLHLLCFRGQVSNIQKEGGPKEKNIFLWVAFELERVLQNPLQGHGGYWGTTTWLVSCKRSLLWIASFEHVNVCSS